ncbi:MAG: hypothetical protein WKG07_27805 [Hymenobacter sp.]
MPPDSPLHADGRPCAATSRDSLRRDFDEAAAAPERLQAYTRRKTIAGKAAVGGCSTSPGAEEERRPRRCAARPAVRPPQFQGGAPRHASRTFDAFGYSLTRLDAAAACSFLEKSGNALHIRTAPLAHPAGAAVPAGPALAPQALAESERLLRQTDEILDARVLVNEAHSQPPTALTSK